MSVEPRGEKLAWACAGLGPLLALCALTWPLAAELSSRHLLTAFGDSHAWVFDHLADGLLSGALFAEGGDLTCEIGFPRTRVLRAIAWAPALLFVPARALFGALAAANLLQLVSLPLGALAAFPLLRRWTDAGPWTAAGLAAAWSLCPTLLATFTTGEISNTQVWIFPCALLALERAWENPRWLPAVALVGLASAFTSPYYALALPPLFAAWAAWRLLRADALPRPRRLLPLVLAGAALAGGLAPANVYYDTSDRGGEESVFRPAVRGQEPRGEVPDPAPIAELDALVRSREPLVIRYMQPAHVVYLGRGLVLLGLLGLLAPGGDARRERGLMSSIALVGLLLALGPWLAIDGRYIEPLGTRIPLPLWPLERLGYPTGQGGLYFRYAALLSLGLTGLAARGLARLPVAGGLAWLLMLAQLAEGLREAQPEWPLPSEPVVDLAQLQAMRGDDGAVMELPFQGALNAFLGQEAMLRAVIHGRPTSALPRAVRSTQEARLHLVNAMRENNRAAVRARLRSSGYRYVLLPKEYVRFTTPSLRALQASLGPPTTQDGGMVLWDLGATEAACRPRTEPRAPDARDQEGPPPTRDGAAGPGRRVPPQQGQPPRRGRDAPPDGRRPGPEERRSR